MIDKVKACIEDHRRTAEKLEDQADKIAEIADAIVTSITDGGKVLIAGNGGSAADAQHIAGELVGRFLYDRRPLPAMALSTDTSVLTCVANDYGFDQIFVRQVEAHIREGDVFWGLSTSGRSANVVAAAEVAKARGATVISFTGRHEADLGRIAQINLAVPADRTDRIQEAHVLAYHIVCQLVEEKLCPVQPKRAST